MTKDCANGCYLNGKKTCSNCGLHFCIVCFGYDNRGTECYGCSTQRTHVIEINSAETLSEKFIASLEEQKQDDFYNYVDTRVVLMDLAEAINSYALLLNDDTQHFQDVLNIREIVSTLPLVQEENMSALSKSTLQTSRSVIVMLEDTISPLFADNDIKTAFDNARVEIERYIQALAMEIEKREKQEVKERKELATLIDNYARRIFLSENPQANTDDYQKFVKALGAKKCVEEDFSLYFYRNLLVSRTPVARKKYAIKQLADMLCFDDSACYAYTDRKEIENICLLLFRLAL